MTAKEANAAAVDAAKDPDTNRALREALLTAGNRRGLVLAAWALRDRLESRRKLRALLRTLRPAWRAVAGGAAHGEGTSGGTAWDSAPWGSFQWFQWGAPPVSVSMIDEHWRIRPVVTTTPALCDVLATVPVTAAGRSALAFLHARLPVELGTRHVITLTDRAEITRLNRTPAVADLATLSPVEAVLVDGEPLASGGPEALTTWRRVRPKAGEQRSLFAGPRTLGGETVGDVVIRTLARLPRMDLRSPLLGDVHRVAALAFGLTGYGPIPDSAGAVFVGGRDTQTNRQRWWTACEWLRTLTVTINERTGEWIGLANVDPNGRGGVHLGPPAWWTGEGRNGRWRLSGTLFRPVRIGGGGRGAGGQAEHYSGLARMLAGFEARLCYSTTAGRGKRGRVPDALRPTRKGGPGLEVFVGWRDTLTLTGENVPDDATARSARAEHERYRQRVEALVAAGYKVGPNGEAAPAGDTVEIVQVQRGARNRPAGLWIRASARFCAAASGRQTWERIPTGRLLRSAP